MLPVAFVSAWSEMYLGHLLSFIQRRLLTITLLVSLVIIAIRICLMPSLRTSGFSKRTFYIDWINSVNISKGVSHLENCQNTIQGMKWVTDELGYVCKRKNLLQNGCCSHKKSSAYRYECFTCSQFHCCSVYEYCVSCCLNPTNYFIWRNVLEQAVKECRIGVLSSTSVFGLCTSVCRTSAKSVSNGNEYRHSNKHFCFGTDPST